MLDNVPLGLLAHHTPNLASLRCELKFTPDDPLVLPAKLTSLQLRMRHGHTDAAINGVLTVLTALPLLSHLHILLSDFERESAVDISILATCPSLMDLTLESFYACFPTLSDIQVEQVRSSLGHLHRFSVGRMKADQLARFLQPPVAVCWRDIGAVRGDARSGELLLRLPTLARLDFTYTRAQRTLTFCRSCRTSHRSA